MRVTRWQAAVSIGVMSLVLTILAAHVRLDAAAAPTSGAAVQSVTTIDHVKPRRDSRGPIPDRFEWTAVKGADSYAVGLWNEVDMRLWRVNNITTNSVAWPKDLVLDSGTYFWSVMAFRNGETVGDSGLAAFIVVK